MFNKNQTPSEFLGEWLGGNYLKKESQIILNSYYSSYRKMYKYQSMHYSNRLIDIVNEIKKSETTLDILDYGSGTGTESLYFAILGANVYGVDYYEKKLLNVAIQRKEILEKELNKKLNVSFECKNLDEMFEHNKKYDILWLNEAFHHIEPREKFMNLIPKLLKDGGKIIISEPNAYNIINQLFFFKHRGFKTIGKTIGDKGEEIIFGDERIIFPYKLRKLLNDKNIKCVSERYFRILPFNNLNNKFLIFLEKFLRKINIFNIHYVFVGIKRRGNIKKL